MSQQKVNVRLFGIELDNMNDGLEVLINIVQDKYGEPLSLTPQLRVMAITELHEMGAFVFRNAVKEIAKRFLISRVTVYKIINHLGWQE